LCEVGLAHPSGGTVFADNGRNWLLQGARKVNPNRAQGDVNAGYGVGTGFETVKELCPDSKILEGFEMKGGVERDGIYLDIKGERAKEAENLVKKWLQRINIVKGAP